MAQRHHRLKTKTLIGLLLAAALAAGCAMSIRDTTPERPPPGRPPTPETTSPAGEALLSQGRAQRASGDYAQASLTLERAIRIDPGHAETWLELARVRLLEGNHAQAGQLARKARSLAPQGSPVAQQSADLIEDASRQQPAPDLD